MKTRTFRFAVTASEWAPEGEPVLLRCATDEAFRQLEQETGKAAERARERLSEIAERRQAPERLAERAERAREASRAHSQGLGRDRGPRQIEGPER